MGASEDLRADRFLRVAAVALGCLAFWRLVFWDPHFDLKPFSAWLFLPTDPFPQAIFLATAALVYRRRESLRSAMRSRGSPVLAALPLLVGSALFVWGHYVNALDLVLVSFMLVSIGVGLLWFGAGFARALAVPWVVLAFAISVPAVATNQAFYVLRLWSAAHAASLLQFFGIPALRDGNVIFGSGVTASVIDTCSGLRTIEILTLVAIFYVSWFPARRLRQWLLIALAPAVGYFFNLVRICVIAVAPTSEFSTAHTAQGLTVYLAAIACLILLDRVLGRVLPSRTQSDLAALRPATGLASQPATELEAPPTSEPGSQRQASSQTEAEMNPASASRSSGRLSGAALAALAVAMLAVSIWMPRWSAYAELPDAPINLPAEIDGWTKGAKIPLDNEFLWTVRYARSEYRIYERDGDEISVFVGEDDRRSRERSIISRKNAVPRRGFEITERDSVALEAVETPVEKIVARSRLAYVLTYHWYEDTDPLVVEIFRALFATDQSRFRRSQPARVIRVAAAIDSTPIGRAEEDAKLRAFASSLAAALRG
jgi:exosortase